MTGDRFFVDVGYNQVNYHKERICGDTFVSKRFDAGDRTIVILSDGLGHGVKANVLSTLTSSMLLNLLSESDDIQRISNMILKTLPVCSVRKISYSTFTFVDIDHPSGLVTIVEYDNPRALLFRGAKTIKPRRHNEAIEAEGGRRQMIYTTKLRMHEGDRIVMMSDGITQSGQGQEEYRFGWGEQNVAEYLAGQLEADLQLSPYDLSYGVLRKSLTNDGMKPHDDMSCAVVWLRKPRKAMLVSCPPSSREHYSMLAARLANSEGDKVVCGYPVAEIIASELGVGIIRDERVTDPDVPPAWRMEGMELVTEGIVTLNKACDILESHSVMPEGIGPAFELCNILLRNDYIEIIIGTKRHVRSSVYVPDEFELRRKVLKRIGRVLEERYMKQVNIVFI